MLGDIDGDGYPVQVNAWCGGYYRTVAHTWARSLERRITDGYRVLNRDQTEILGQLQEAHRLVICDVSQRMPTDITSFRALMTCGWLHDDILTNYICLIKVCSCRCCVLCASLSRWLVHDNVY